jgi:uncharacterized protein (DUF697 family)/GTP-binding protein EngB required for normal cell division
MIKSAKNASISKFVLSGSGGVSTDVQKKLDDQLEQLKTSISKPNVMLIGGTGVGKSSLLNSCFGQTFAKTGVGRPVTQYLQRFAHDDFPVVIFDTKGYEIGSQQESAFFEDVINFAVQPQVDVTDAVHLVWYCIQAVGSRVTDFDIDCIKKLQSAHLPVAVVLTKSDLVSDEDAQSLRQAILERVPNAAIYETSVNPDLKGLEINDLIQWSVDRLPDGIQMAFVAAQKKNIKIKKDSARKIVLQHAFGSGTVGFTPIPFSDAPLIIANQYALLARLLYIYQLDGLDNKFSIILKTTVATLLPMGGRYLSAQLLKFIPVVGTTVAGLINAGIATTITMAFGFAVSEMCAKIAEIMIDGGIEEVNKYIQQLDQNFLIFFEEAMKDVGQNMMGKK